MLYCEKSWDKQQKEGPTQLGQPLSLIFSFSFSPFFHFSILEWAIVHTAGYSQRGSQCRQHRHDDLNHRLPKLFVLHTLILSFFF